MLKNTPRRNRTMYIAVTRFLAMGLVGGVAAIVSGMTIDSLNGLGEWHVGIYRFSGFHVAFAASLLLRLFAIPLTARLRERSSVPVPVVFEHLRTTSPLRRRARTSRSS